MPRFVIVEPGDHLVRIAVTAGIRDPARIWDHPDNAALRERRQNPNVLAPGDELLVPDVDAPTFEIQTGRRHAFVVPTTALELRCRLLDPFGEPRRDLAVRCLVDDVPAALQTDGEGMLVVPIRAASERVRIELPELAYELEVGHLDPHDLPSGIRARLMALGYAAGEADGDDPEDLRFAVELFQHDHGLPVDGEQNAALLDKLVEVFGS
jgi:hypothetical protein